MKISNFLQKHLREQGKEYKRVSPNKEYSTDTSNTPLSPQEISEVINNWKESLGRAFQRNIEWIEGVEVPYYTKQFSEFDEVYALNCYALYPELNIAEIFPQDLNITQDKIIKAIEKEEKFCFFGKVELYLPDKLPGSEIYELYLPNDRKATCSSVPYLLQELENITQRVTGISIEDLDRASEEEVFEKYALQNISLAKALFGLCKLYQMNLFSQKFKHPIILDY